jgi:dTDP-4-dehydrorhamnose 3,5-epimerase
MLPELTSSGSHTDERGKLVFFNDLDLSGIKRIYAIEHPNTKIIRAWQGHKVEQKWFFVIRGTFKIVLVQPDNWERPSSTLVTNEYLLTASNDQILHIPGNYANGLQAMENDSKITVFSNFDAQQSSQDNFRFDYRLWYEW